MRHLPWRKKKVQPKPHRPEEPSPHLAANNTPTPVPASSSSLSLAATTSELNISSQTQPIDLWDQAYQLLRTEPANKKLLEGYEKILSQEAEGNNDGPSADTGTLNREEKLSMLISKKLQVIDEARWKFRVGGETVEIKAQMERIVKATLFAKDFISSVASSEPHAALAWTGVCLLLPLLLNPSAQQKSLIDGLDQISEVICRYTVVEDTYRLQTASARGSSGLSLEDSKINDHLQDNIVKLYSKILQYQAEVICQIFRHGITRWGRDVLKIDRWDTLLLEIQAKDKTCKDLFSALDSDALRKGFSDQAAQIAKLDSAFVKSLEGLKTATDEISTDLKNNQERQRAEYQSAEESRCLQALYTSDYRSFKARNPDRVAGTCQWFLRSGKYENWLTNESSDLLWVTGDPGCGKSVLSKSLIDNELQSIPSTSICYFFFKDDNADQRNAAKAICALLHQILCACHDHSMLQMAVRVFETHGPTMSESFETMRDLLLEIVQEADAGQVICVLDALDECEERGKSMIIDFLNAFVSRIGQRKGRLKFLVTSRPYYDIEEHFSPHTIRLAGEEESELIQQEIDLFIRSHVPQIATQLKLGDKAKQVLEHKLLAVEHRTYLWLHLVLEDIVKRSLEVKTAKGMEQILIELPKTIYEAYEHILERSPKPETARRLLHIVLAAVRPLTLREMNMALHIEESNKSHKDVDLIPYEAFPGYLKNLCGLFVTTYDSRVYLLHQTAKEFLVSQADIPSSDNRISSHKGKWNHTFAPETSNLILVRICLIYLLFDVFEDTPLNLSEFPYGLPDAESSEAEIPTVKPSESHDSDEIPDLKTTGGADKIQRSAILNSFDSQDRNKVYAYGRSHHLIFYAACKWSYHFKSAGSNPEAAQWRQVCNTGSRRWQNWFLLYCLSETDLNSADIGNVYWEFDSFSLAAFLGHDTMVERLCEESHLDSERRVFGVALFWAVRNGHESTVQILLDQGALTDQGVFMNSCEFEYTTPLSLASRRGLKSMVKLLLEEDAAVDFCHENGRNPLSSAAGSGQSGTMQLLMDNGAAIDLRDQGGRTPLSYAAQGGYKKSMQLLLNNGATIDLEDLKGRTPLSWATGSTRSESTQLLIDTGAAIDSSDRGGRTPLSYAAQDGNKKSMQLLLENDAAIDSVDAEGRTPLSYAAFGDLFESRDIQQKAENRVKLLLDKGASIDLRDYRGRSPLSYAAMCANAPMVRLLFKSGPVVLSRDNEGKDILYLTIHALRQRLLLYNNRTEQGDPVRTILSLATCSEAVKCLLNVQTALYSWSHTMRSVKICQIIRKYQTMAKLLIKYGADPNTSDFLPELSPSSASSQANEPNL